MSSMASTMASLLLTDRVGGGSEAKSGFVAAAMFVVAVEILTLVCFAVDRSGVQSFRLCC